MQNERSRKLIKLNYIIYHLKCNELLNSISFVCGSKGKMHSILLISDDIFHINIYFSKFIIF